MKQLIDVDDLKDYVSGLIDAQYSDVVDVDYETFLLKRGYVHCAEDVTAWISKHRDKYWHDMTEKPNRWATHIAVVNEKGEYAIRSAFMLDGLYPKAIAWGYVPTFMFYSTEEEDDE